MPVCLRVALLTALGAVVLFSACTAVDPAEWRTGVVHGAYFALPVEKIFTGSSFPEAENCFNAPYSDLWQEFSLAPICEIAECCKARGMDFILLLYPDPWQTAELKLGSSNAVSNSSLAAEVFRRNGITVADPWEKMSFVTEPGLWFYYDTPGDPHPDVPVQKISAEILAELIGKDFAGEGNFSFSLRPSLTSRHDPVSGEQIMDSIVLYNGSPAPMRNPSSPVLVAGNSLCATPSGNELSARLGVQLGVLPDTLRIDGNGIARSLAAVFFPPRDSILDGKKVLILAIGYNQLFERWTAPSEIVLRNQDRRVTAAIPPDEWQKDFEQQEEYDGLLPFISRSWRSAYLFTAEEANAAHVWRGSAAGLEDMKIYKNLAPAVFFFRNIVLPEGKERTASFDVFTSAPPGYLEIRIIGDGEECLYETVNTSVTENIIFRVPDTVDSVDIELESTLPEIITAAGYLRISAAD